MANKEMGAMLDGALEAYGLVWKEPPPEPPSKMTSVQQALAEEIMNSDSMMGSDDLSSRVVARTRQLEAEKIGERFAAHDKAEAEKRVEVDARTKAETLRAVEKSFAEAERRAEVDRAVAAAVDSKLERQRRYVDGRLVDAKRKKGRR